jgi:hypothetical protein
MAATLPKSEHLCGKSAIAGLMDHGRGGTEGCIRYKFLPRTDGADASRILVSVPKRRIRESYRLQKQLLSAPVDVLFVYLPREVLPFADIYAAMTAVLTAIARVNQDADSQ